MKKYLILALSFFISAVSYAKHSAWLIPRTIYVGDPATLVVSLPGAENADDIVLGKNSAGFPTDANIDFHRVVLERRIAGSRLLIEFTAFVPGVLEFPAIEIGQERFSGLAVNVGSIIDTSETLTANKFVLSRPASSLAMPGTAFMLYGTMAGLFLLFLLVLMFAVRGRKIVKGWIEKWKRRQLFNSMKSIEKRLSKSLQRGVDKRSILNKLSIEFRIFLSILSETNCRAMTAREFETLPELFPPDHFELAAKYTSAFLADFFQRCDEVRFSGSNLEAQTITGLLADLRLYLAAMEKAYRKNSSPPLAAAAAAGTPPLTKGFAA